MQLMLNTNKMKQKFVNVILILILVVVCVEAQERRLVDYYFDKIKSHTNKAINYKFQTDAKEFEANDKRIREFGTFDFIIIGASSSGCVIANRLSEISNWTVLLIEAGTHRDENLSDIPALYTVDSFSKFNWGYQTVPQKHGCLGSVDKKCTLHRGKGIGGTSLIDDLVYTRGNHRDYDRWAEHVNSTIWSYKNLLPYFKKSENFKNTDSFPAIDMQYHGYDGPLHVTHSTPPQKCSIKIITDGGRTGYKTCDYNGRHQAGFSTFQYYTYNGRRFDHQMAYIEPVCNRPNLKVLDKSYVTKIEVDKHNKRAIGVIFTRGDKTYRAQNTKEVVLSAGAIASPKILLLSGIGPKKDLQDLEIPLIQNLPVGEIFRDHPVIPVIFSSNMSVVESPEDSIKYFLKGDGALTRSAPLDAMAFFKTAVNTSASPEFEFHFQNLSNTPLLQRYLGYKDDIFNVLNVKVPHPFSLSTVLLHPKSYGTIKLRNANPFEHPLIDPNILSDEKDVEALRLGFTIALTPDAAFRTFNTSLAVDNIPQCTGNEHSSKKLRNCYIKYTSTVANHPISSCRMGTSSEDGVVDEMLNVFGINGLRVADESVIPVTISGSTNAARTVIGEKVSVIIRTKYIHNTCDQKV